MLTTYAIKHKSGNCHPFQKALKLPATIPEILSTKVHLREAVTISCTCLDFELVNAFVNSGIIAAAKCAATNNY